MRKLILKRKVNLNFKMDQQSRNTRNQTKAGSLVLTAAYILCLIAVWSFLVFEIVQCYIKYDSWPTYHNKSIVQQKHTIFPDITLCAAGKHGLNQDVLEVMS